MKKVLLATTILGMSAGFAAAEIGFTGSASAGFASESGANFEPYSKFELGVAATGESDSGLTFGASGKIAGGASPDRGGDFAASGADNMAVAPAAPTAGFFKPTIFIAGDFGKVTVKANGFKEYQADTLEHYDLEYTHTIAGVSVGVRTALDSADASAGNSSLSLGYTIGSVALGANFDQNGSAWGVSAAYTLNALTFTLATDNASLTSLKVAYKGANGFSGDVKADSASAWEANVGYTANGLTVGAFTNSASDWKVTGSYDLGGGLTAEAGVNGAQDMYLGAKMAF